MEKYGTVRHATHDNIERVHLALWITKAANTH